MDGQLTLQEKLEKLTEWSDKRLLKFHPQKYKLMHIIGENCTDIKFIFNLMGSRWKR